MEDLKSQAVVIDNQKAQQTKEELQKVVAKNRVLSDDKTTLL